MNETKTYNKSASIAILGWFLILCFGPYFQFDIAPLRIDHFVYPLLGTLLLIILTFKNKKIIIPSCLYIIFAFLLISFIATYFAIMQEGFHISKVPFLAALDNHLRVVLTFLLVSALTYKNKINIQWLLKWLIIFSAMLSVFGFFQVYDGWDAIHKLVERISIDYYSGRSDRGVSIPKLLMRIRAVSVFYLPGNLALFMSLVLSLLIFARKSLNFNRYMYYILLTLNMIALVYSGSKGLFVAIFFFILILGILKKWQTLNRVILIITISLLIGYNYSHSLTRMYLSYVDFKDIRVLFNKSLGQRFGKFHVDKPKQLENQTKKTVNKSVDTTNLHKSSDIQPQTKSDIIDKTAVKKKFEFNDGNLSSALKVVNRNKLIGVGFVSNVDYGDSMLINLLVRGGIIGVILYLFFIIVVSIKIYLYNKNLNTKEYALAWIVCTLIFTVSGIAYPSFIQDRTTDIFWWIGALLMMNPVINNE